MERKHIEKKIEHLGRLSTGGLHMADFLLTWEKTDEEIAAVFTAAEILRGLRRNNLSARFFDSGLAISIFRDNSTRTQFSFASAANFLGLALQDLDEGKSQIAHGETVRETANIVSFMADVKGSQRSSRRYPQSASSPLSIVKRLLEITGLLCFSSVGSAGRPSRKYRR